MEGQIVATQLMLELTGARLVDGTIDIGGPGPDPITLRLRDEKVTRLLGTEVPMNEQRDILERLDFGVHDSGDGLDVTVPAFRRNDVTREVDLIEEVARLWGLEKLPATIPGHGLSARLTVEQRLRRRAGDALVGAGFSEAIGWSFQSPSLARALRIDAPAVVLRNPLSEDLSVMRTTLLGSLLNSVRHNTARGAEDVRLFEEGSVYFDRPHRREPTAAEARSTPLPDERMHLAALMTGKLRPASWGENAPPTRRLLRRQGRAGDGAGRAARPVHRRARVRPVPAPGPRGARARQRRGRGLARRDPPGRGRGVRPRARRGLRARPQRRAPARRRSSPHYEDLTSFPGIRQDLAFWVPADRTASDLVEVVQRRGRQAAQGRVRVRRLPPRGPDVARRCASSSARATAR